jgi:hypothetical protein
LCNQTDTDPALYGFQGAAVADSHPDYLIHAVTELPALLAPLAATGQAPA